MSDPGTAESWRRDIVAFLTDAVIRWDGQSYGANLDPWQVEDFRALQDGPASAYISRPRGHAKTVDLAAIAVHHLLTTRGARAYAFATDQQQALHLHDSVAGFARRSPALREALKVGRYRAEVPGNGAQLEIWPADAAGSWGLRPSLALLDEVAQWRTERHTELFHAVVSSMGKVPGARLIAATTAGFDRGSVGWTIRELARTSPDWTFVERGQCASWISPDFLRQQKLILPAHVYEMVHENRWTEGGGAYLSNAEIASIFQGSLSPQFACSDGPHFVGLDVGLSRDSTVCAVLHVSGDGTLEIDSLQTWRGSRGNRVSLDAVEEWILDAVTRFQGAQVIADPWQGVSTIQRLQAAGVRAEDIAFTAQYRSRLFSNLLELVRTERLRCYEHSELRSELLGLEFRQVGGTLRVDHRSAGHDDHVVAIALAALAAVQAVYGAPLFPHRTIVAAIRQEIPALFKEG